MLLSDLYVYLSQGELRQFAIGGDVSSGSTAIASGDYFRLIPFINLGLGELHKRFLLKTKLLYVRQLEEVFTYSLHPSHGETSGTADDLYIIDSVTDVFTDVNEILKIEAVIKEDGTFYALNDDSDDESLYTPTDHSIQVTINEAPAIMAVQYRANHATLIANNSPAQTVDIPYTYVEALLLFIGGRYLATAGSQENVAAGMAMLQRYEQACQRIEMSGLDNKDNSTNVKLDDNGWV